MKIIGRQFQFGVSKEVTRGTIPASVTYWQPFTDLSFDEKRKFAMENQSYGVVEDHVGEMITKATAEGSCQGLLGDATIGLFLLSLLGTDAPTLHSSETLVYDHLMTVQQGTQHQSLSFYVHDPATAIDYGYANGTIEKLEISYELQKYITFNATIKALSGTTESTYTPSTTAENHFVAQYLNLKVCPNAGSGANSYAVVSGTGTAATTIHVTGLSFSTTLLKVGMIVTGTNIPAGTTVAAMVSDTAFDLSQASTGAASDLYFGGLTATGTAASTVHVTSCSINPQVNLSVGMTVMGTNIPAGATIAKIVSSTAFDLSVASSGAIGAMIFGGANIKVKSAKITLNQNIEDQDVLGSLSPADFLNKQFQAEGQIEAIWQNETDFKSPFINNTYLSLVFDLKNTDVVIGNKTNPRLKLDFSKNLITEVSRPIKVGDLVYQTIKFNAVYDTTNSYMVKATLTNIVASY